MIIASYRYSIIANSKTLQISVKNPAKTTRIIYEGDIDI